MTVIIRQASSDDFSAIVKVHIECFPDSFSTSLARQSDLLRKYYLEFYAQSPELFIVAEDEAQRIIGFCMGYYCENGSQINADFKRKNFTTISFTMMKLLLLLDKAAWSKVISLIRAISRKLFRRAGSSKTQRIKVSGDLLSICVVEEFRGSGTAQRLITAFEKVLAENGRKYCLLSAKRDNARGIHFYRKMGYQSTNQDGTAFAKEI